MNPRGIRHMRYGRRAQSWHRVLRTVLLATLLLLMPCAPRVAAADPELEALQERLYCPILAHL